MDEEKLSADEEEREKLSSKISENEQIDILLAEKRRLENIVNDKDDVLRKLNLVKTYRAKNNLNRTRDLVTKWRIAAQDAVERLFLKVNMDKKPTMLEFLSIMNIDAELIHYDAESDTFY